MSDETKAVVKLVREPVPPAQPPLLFPKGWTFINAVEMAKPLPPIRYLVEALSIAPGPPTCFSGYGYSRKTLALQDMALSVAAGKPLWGIFHIRKGRALHLDFEQGSRTTMERYQRFAKGYGFDLAGLKDNLIYSPYPPGYLDDDRATDDYERACDGFDLVILDSFRAACPKADENKSDIRKHLDKLARISEKTGAIFVIIMHAGKPLQQGLPGIGEDAAPAKYSGLRGSSALFDGLNGHFVLHGEKNKPTRVQHEKERTRGQTVGDFGLDAEDVAINGDPRAGLRMIHLEKEQLDALRREGEGSIDENQERIVSFLRKCSRRQFRGTKETFRQKLSMGATPFRAALLVLVEDRKVLQPTETTWTLSDGAV